MGNTSVKNIDSRLDDLLNKADIKQGEIPYLVSFGGLPKDNLTAYASVTQSVGSEGYQLVLMKPDDFKHGWDYYNKAFSNALDNDRTYVSNTQDLSKWGLIYGYQGDNNKLNDAFISYSNNHNNKNVMLGDPYEMNGTLYYEAEFYVPFNVESSIPAINNQHLAFDFVDASDTQNVCHGTHILILCYLITHLICCIPLIFSIHLSSNGFFNYIYIYYIHNFFLYY